MFEQVLFKGSFEESFKPSHIKYISGHARFLYVIQ